MASSSSSLPPTKPYEVFISFRGEDTRNNFISHLYSALKDRGIRTYFDEYNLQKGQIISTELVKAIQESSIAIVVLSTNYASSTWCLDELAKIIDCKHKFGLVVFPIFYHVDPSDIRKQKNSFGEALSKHQENLNDGGKKVKIWRDALTEVANLTGVNITGEENEAKCIKEIADTIFRQLPVEASQFTKSLVGIDSCISKIKELMSIKFNEVIFIGLCGMGGIGKTTTARAIFEDCKNKFEGSCFLPDVRQSKNTMENLQKKLLSKVLKTYVDICDVVEGCSIIKERLSMKKILLVIDDVDHIEQVNALAKECDWFGGGSRIIITTRDRRLLNDDHIVNYDVKTLPEEEALHLFCVHAFKNKHPPEDYKDVALEVVSYASGLPLALKVLGNHFKGQKEKSFWKGALKRLKDLPDSEITSRLQISYDDGLNDNEKDIFLNIACFFSRYRCSWVKERLGSLGLFPEEGVDVLIQKSLIHIGKYDLIEMHDLLQEMGLNIIRQEANRDVRRYSRLWLQKDIVDVLSGIKVPSEAEWIFLDNYSYGVYAFFDSSSDDDDFRGDASYYYSSDDDDDNLGWNKKSRGDNDIKMKLIWEGGLTKMNKLTFLELSGDILEGNHVVNVTQSCGHVEPCPSLRWFSWNKYPGQSLPESFHPRYLVHLRMKNSNIKETPDVSHMPNLEVLNLRGSRKLVKVHPSLGDHTKMKLINFSDCIKIKRFPKINQMESLEVLNLSYTKLQSFPEIYGNLNSLRKLRILGFKFYVEELRICPPIQVGLESFPRLVSLKITDSGIVQTPDFRHLPYLEMLDLSGSKQLVEVHESLGDHKGIKSIRLGDCSKLKEFPRIRDMVSLEELNLSRTCLQSFPEVTGNVNRLVKLQLDHTKITTLPWSIERAASLETISLRGCKYLLTLPLISSLGLQSRVLKYFGDRKLLCSIVRTEAKDLIVSQGKGQICRAQFYFGVHESLEELPETLVVLSSLEGLLSGVVFLHIQGQECPTLTRWIYSNFVDLLHKYQHLCKLQLHQEDRENLLFLDDFLQAFGDVGTVSNMLRERDKYFEVEVCVPDREIPIPSGFQYRICGSCVNVSIKAIDKLRGICICCIDAKLTGKYVPSAFLSSTSVGDCDCESIGNNHSMVLVMYIPIDTIKRDWDGQKERILSMLCLNLDRIRKSRTPMWGLSLVYDEDEGEVDHDIVITKDCGDWIYRTMTIKIEESRGIRQSLHEQQLDAAIQLIGVEDEDGSMVYREPQIRGEAGLGEPFSNFVAESSRDNRDNLDSLYCPPFALMSHGSFEEAKDTAKIKNKWLLLNLQSTKEFSSYMLNRDTWANEVVAQIIKTNFIFWQVNNDTEEGHKICIDYRIHAAPIILVIHPLTGQEIRSWHGMVQPENLLEGMMPYLDRSPADHPIIPAHKRRRCRVTENIQAPPQPWNNESNYDDKELQQPIAASMASMNEENVPSEKEMAETVTGEEDMAMAKPNYPPLPEEPMSDRNLLCRILFRLPDGRRLHRNFLCTDPIQLLWSFCCTQLEEEAKTRPFRLAQNIPGSEPLDYDSNVTLGDSGLANSVISVTWL